MSQLGAYQTSQVHAYGVPPERDPDANTSSDALGGDQFDQAAQLAHLAHFYQYAPGMTTYDRYCIPTQDATPTDDGDFPEGGRGGWTVVAGAWCCIFVSAGWISSIGDFQAYYEANQLRAYSSSAIGWIPSLQTYLLFTLAPVSGHVFDSHGPRVLLVAGSCLHILGLLLLSLCTRYYQIFLAQSVCSAVGASAIYWTAILSVSTWFQRRRGLATGIAASGSSVGGAVGTAVIPSLFKEIGFGTALRIIAFAYLCLLFIAVLTVRSRIKHTPSGFKLSALKEPFREPSMWILSFAGFFLALGLYLPYDFLVVEALGSGISQTLANNLLVILNASGIFGRIAPAWACDRFGRFNVAIACNFIATLLIFALWLPASGEAAREGFAALYGIFSGALFSILPTLPTQICPDVKMLGVYTGATFLAISPGFLVTLPIGGALVSRNGAGSSTYLPMKLFCGSVMFIGGCLFVVARAFHLKARKAAIADTDEDLPQATIRIMLS